MPFAHPRQDLAAQSGKSEQIDFQLPARFFERYVLDGAEIPESGVVHEHVHRPDLLQTGVNGPFVAHVQKHRRDTVLAERLHKLDTPRRGKHLMPFSGQLTGSLEADSARCARHEDSV